MRGVWRIRVWLRTRRQNSMPSTPGMLTSVRMSHGRFSRAIFRRLLAVRRLVDREAAGARHVVQEGAKDRVVVHHQHGAQGVGQGLQLLQGRRAAGQARRIVGHDRLAVVVELLEAGLGPLGKRRDRALHHLAALEDGARLTASCP